MRRLRLQSPVGPITGPFMEEEEITKFIESIGTNKKIVFSTESGTFVIPQNLINQCFISFTKET